MLSNVSFATGSAIIAAFACSSVNVTPCAFWAAITSWTLIPINTDSAVDSAVWAAVATICCPAVFEACFLTSNAVANAVPSAICFAVNIIWFSICVLLASIPFDAVFFIVSLFELIPATACFEAWSPIATICSFFNALVLSFSIVETDAFTFEFISLTPDATCDTPLLSSFAPSFNWFAPSWILFDASCNSFTLL